MGLDHKRLQPIPEPYFTGTDFQGAHVPKSQQHNHNSVGGARRQWGPGPLLGTRNMLLYHYWSNRDVPPRQFL